MEEGKPAKGPAKPEAEDRDESVSMMEPVKLPEGSKHRPALTELAFDLTQAAAGFKNSLPKEIVGSLADLVRSMNCYYSNLIEGHDTHPVDIERALKGDFSQDARKRNLQLEAKAHIAVQRWIDGGGLRGRAVSSAGICETHKRFCDLLPAELLKVTDPQTGEELDVMPGAYRNRDVMVGRHTAISPGAIPRFLRRFEDVFTGLGKAETILGAAAAHHRLVWIHPFLDGNGRVTRLISHALLLEALDSGGIWSVSRGLARQEARYKQLLANCDLPRRNDLDGRGHLSEQALFELTRFFLETCLDQVRFMEKLVQPERLRERILKWAETERDADRLPDRSGKVLEALLFRGSLARGDVPDVTGMSERQSRRLVSALMDYEVVTSASTRAPLFLAFPASLAQEWMPGLFPDQVST
jgi:Fic family protein